MINNKENYIYLYCITEDLPLMENIQEYCNGIYLVPAAGLYAFVSDVPECEFGEGRLESSLNDLEWVKMHVEKHEQVIERIMKTIPVVPAKFATVFFYRQNLEDFMGKYAEELYEKLDYVRNKEEWGVKFYCDDEKLKREVAVEDTAVAKIEETINSSSPGKAYLLNKKKIKMIDNMTDNNIDSNAKMFQTRLEKYSCHVKINDSFPEKLKGREDRMILNAAFLVDKNNVSEFIGEVETLKNEFAVKGFNFEYTGPWPPYNFCGLSQK